MDSSPEVRIGERLRFYRMSKGKTQAVVAGLAGVTEEYLSQIERGLKTPTVALLHRFAKILGVRISELLGEQAAEQSIGTEPAGSALQRALLSYTDQSRLAEVDVAALRGRVETAWSIWQGRPRRFTEGSAVLPALLSDVQGAHRAVNASGSEQERREMTQLAADTYFLMRTYAKRIGRTDLALLVADCPAQATRESIRHRRA